MFTSIGKSQIITNSNLNSIFRTAIILLIILFSTSFFSCEADDKISSTKIPDEIIRGDSLVYINPTMADSIYRSILKNTNSNDLAVGRAKLGLAKILNSKGKKDSVDILFQQVAELINIGNDTLLMLGYLLDRGNFFMQEYENDSVEKYFKDGLRIAYLSKNEDYIQSFSISHGQFYIDKGDYKFATKVLIDGLKSAEQIGNLAHQAVALQNLAIAASRTNDFGEAIELQKRSLTIKKQLNLMSDYAEGLQNLGIYHRNMQNFDSALACYEEAYNVMSGLGDSMGILKLNYNRGLVLKNMGKISQAEKIFNMVYDKSCKMDQPMGKMFALAALAGIYEEQGDFDKALKTSDLALSMAENKNFVKWSEFLQRKQEILAKMGKFEDAYKILVLANHAKDSLVSIEKQKEILNLKTQFETEKKNAENKILKQDLENKSNTIALQRIITMLSVILLIIIIVASIFRIKSITRQKNLEAMKSELLEATAETQTAKLDKMQVENQLKAEVLSKFELEGKLKEERIRKMELEAGIREQEMIYQTLARTDLTQLLASLKEKLLPYMVKLSRKKDKEAFSALLSEFERDIQRDPLSEFELLFQQLHPNFFQELIARNANFTKSELQIAAMIRLNLSTKDICRLVNLSSSTIETTRFHIRRKLNLETGENLTSALMMV